jgi:hypothetical protein
VVKPSGQDQEGKLAALIARDLSVVAALDAELAVLADIDAVLAGSSLAMSARALALKLDDGETSATAAASCAKELREHLSELRRLAPEAVLDTEVDEITARAAQKLRSVK